MKRKLFIITVLALAVALMAYFFLGRQPKALGIVSTSPESGAQLISPNSQIAITFNRSVSAQDTGRLTYLVSPETAVVSSYQNTTVTLSPQAPLALDTKYEVSVLLSGKTIFTFGFTTIPLSQEKIDEDSAKQLSADLAFGQEYQKLIANYPWYTSLPIETNEYRIVYDFEKASFKIRLKLVPQDEKTKEDLAQKALDSLKAIGVKEPIKYYVVVGED